MAGAAGRRRTLVLVNLASVMERADEALLPTGYREVGEALGATPAGLGALTLCRSAVQQAASYPLAANAAARCDRVRVVAAGSAVARGMTGVGLALVTPAIQSLVADCTDDNKRGSAFGWLQLSGNLGSLIGGLFAIMLASTTFMGVAGWCIAFHAVALISVIVGILVRLYAEDPHFQNVGKGKQLFQKPAWSEMKDLVIEAIAVIKIPSFQIIMAQGITGSFPWSAQSFAPMWLELMGFTHTGTGILILMITFAATGSLGGVLGGKMGDYLARRSPNFDRIILSQISSASAVPFTALLLLGLPDDPSTGFLHGFVILIVGLSTSWNAPATNKSVTTVHGPSAVLLLQVYAKYISNA